MSFISLPAVQSLACCAAIALAIATPSAAQTAGPTAGEHSWGARSWKDTAHGIIIWISDGFDKTPEIIVGAGLALTVPLLAIIGLLLRRRANDDTTAERADDRSIPLSGWNTRGLLVVANSRGEVHEVGHGLVRIGRENDNDVRLMHNTVHRYHAVFERTGDAEFYVTDVSGAGGNGVRVDGSKVKRSRLRGGEVIELGKARLRFQLAAARD